MEHRRLRYEDEFEEGQKVGGVPTVTQGGPTRRFELSQPASVSYLGEKVEKTQPGHTTRTKPFVIILHMTTCRRGGTHLRFVHSSKAKRTFTIR